MTRFLAVDPGTSVGWCVVDTDSPRELFQYGQCTPAEFVAAWHVMLPTVDEVVCEKFVIGKRTLVAQGQGVQDALDVEGWLRLECWRRGITFTHQRNGDVLAFSTDDKLKALGWWNLGQARSNRDARSAARHMLKYLVDRGFGNLLTVHG